MAYPYSDNTRYKGCTEVLRGTLTSNKSDGIILDLPPGAWLVGLAIKANGTNQTIIVTSLMYTDEDQVGVSTGPEITIPGGTTPAASYTLSAGSGGQHLTLSPHSNLVGTDAPVIAPYGLRILASTATTAGDYTLTYTAVEL